MYKMCIDYDLIAECYDDDDDYGQSYEDRYCVSPGTGTGLVFLCPRVEKNT